MKPIYKYIVKPKDGERYKNEITTSSGGKIVINSDVYNHEYVSRIGVVLAVPSSEKRIKIGDEVIVHHNVFRRWYNQRGEVKNSSNYIKEDEYGLHKDQIFMYRKPGGSWQGFGDSCFVSPVKETEKWSTEAEHESVGILEVDNEYLNYMGVKAGDTIAFTPHSKYEFIVEGNRVFRMRARDICLKLESSSYEKHQPSWVTHMS